MDPIHQVLEDQNRVASVAGEIPTNIISMSFRNHFASIGVVGAIIAILIVAKSKQYKEVGKIASVPYIFNIGEPALFGIPLMLNFSFIIPLFLQMPSQRSSLTLLLFRASPDPNWACANSVDDSADH